MVTMLLVMFALAASFVVLYAVFSMIADRVHSMGINIQNAAMKGAKWAQVMVMPSIIFELGVNFMMVWVAMMVVKAIFVIAL
jgi:hypothetical protein